MKLPSIIIALNCWVFAVQSHACSCKEENIEIGVAVSQAYKGASAVVVAQVTSIERKVLKETWMDKKDQGAMGEVTHFFTVDSWKGSLGRTFTTKTLKTPGLCGMSFVDGKSYLLYLYGPDVEGYYSASICSRSTRLEDGKADINILKGIVPKTN